MKKKFRFVVAISAVAVLTYLVSTLSYAGDTTYTIQEILNKAYRDNSGGSLGSSTSKTAQGVLNSVFDSTQNSLVVSIGTSTASAISLSTVTITGYLQHRNNMTKAQIVASTPTARGQMYFASDEDFLYISTGTAKGAFKKATLGAP